MATRKPDFAERLDVLTRRLAIILEHLDGALGGMEESLVRAIEDARLMEAPPARLALPEPSAIVEAMVDLNAHEQPVTATAIANVFWHGEQGHGDVIRLGQRLGMLSSVGLAVRAGRRGKYGAHVWALPKAAA